MTSLMLGLALTLGAPATKEDPKKGTIARGRMGTLHCRSRRQA